jgi:hypothetical protein
MYELLDEEDLKDAEEERVAAEEKHRNKNIKRRTLKAAE